MYLYPAVREHVPGGEDLAEEVCEHSQIDRTPKDLEDTEPTDAGSPRLAEHAGHDVFRGGGDKVQKAKQIAPSGHIPQRRIIRR